MRGAVDSLGALERPFARYDRERSAAHRLETVSSPRPASASRISAVTHARLLVAWQPAPIGRLL